MINEAKYDALTIAKYVVSYCYEHEILCSYLKLQQLLYFIQLHFLVNTKEKQPCYNDPIIATGHGPIVPIVQKEYALYGCGEIPCFSKDKYYQLPIDGDDMKEINCIIEFLKDYCSGNLVDIILNQKPWKDTFKDGYDRVIPLQCIAGYFTD